MSGKSHEKVAGFVRNGWQPPAGMGGWSTPESVAGYGRISQMAKKLENILLLTYYANLFRFGFFEFILFLFLIYFDS